GELARVVAEAAAGEHAVEHGQRSLQARGATADDLGGGERELDRRTQSVIRDRVEEQPVELHELAVQVARRPAHDGASIRTAEVSVVVRTDLVSLAIGGRDLPECARDDLTGRAAALRAREPNVRAAAGVPRRPVEEPTLLREQVDAANEEGEVSMCSAGDRAPVRPELRAACAVERDDK